jgi:hypothetical protein
LVEEKAVATFEDLAAIFQWESRVSEEGDVWNLKVFANARSLYAFLLVVVKRHLTRAVSFVA